MIRDMPVVCALCGGGEVALYWETVWRRADLRVFRCRECGVLFLWPLLGHEESAEYYVHYAVHLHERGVAQNETPGETFRRRAPLGKYRLEVAGQFLKEGDKILEVGGGCGNFLVDVLQNGKISQAVLVESCKEHLAFARETFGMEGYEDLQAVRGYFNVIFLFHILEHIADPVEFLERCACLLSEGGLIVAEVPCSEDPLLSLYDCGAYKDFYFQPMHPFVHCNRSLQVLFNRAGYENVRFIPFQRYPLSNHLQWLSRGRPGGNARFTEVLGSDCEKAYQMRLEAAGFVDTLFGIFRRR